MAKLTVTGVKMSGNRCGTVYSNRSGKVSVKRRGKDNELSMTNVLESKITFTGVEKLTVTGVKKLTVVLTVIGGIGIRNSNTATDSHELVKRVLCFKIL